MTAHTRVVVHDVPVAVIPTRFWENFQKPILPSYDVSTLVFLNSKYIMIFASLPRIGNELFQRGKALR